MHLQVLLSLLREKKARNFNHHSDLCDFFKDSFTTFKYEFIDLLQKHQLADLFKQEEFSGLQVIFQTYFNNFIAEARRLEQEHHLAVI